MTMTDYDGKLIVSGVKSLLSKGVVSNCVQLSVTQDHKLTLG
jgi:hypothetical protein